MNVGGVMTGVWSCCGEMPGSSPECFAILGKTQQLEYSALRAGGVAGIVGMAQNRRKAVQASPVVSRLNECGVKCFFIG